MLSLEDIKNNSELINAIDWDMTPEEAVTLYLEWGNNWSHGRMVKSKKDVSYYFVVNTWETPPRIYLIRRDMELAEEMAAVDIPDEYRERFLKAVGHHPGVYSLGEELKRWLMEILHAPRTLH